MARIVQSPAVTIWTVAPDSVHTEVVAELKDTARPEPDVALTAKSAAPYVLPPRAPNVIVCESAPTPMLWVAVGAAFHVWSPAWLASTTQVPVARKVTVLPAIEQTPQAAGSIESVTGRPPVEVVVTV